MTVYFVHDRTDGQRWGSAACRSDFHVPGASSHATIGQPMHPTFTAVGRRGVHRCQWPTIFFPLASLESASPASQRKLDCGRISKHTGIFFRGNYTSLSCITDGTPRVRGGGDSHRAVRLETVYLRRHHPTSFTNYSQLVKQKQKNTPVVFLMHIKITGLFYKRVRRPNGDLTVTSW